jgi:hypothetical protein
MQHPLAVKAGMQLLLDRVELLEGQQMVDRVYLD